MKKFLISAALFVTGIVLLAQTPQKMSYQSVVRNSNDELVTNSNIGAQISIIQHSSAGTAIYLERHFPTTNANGLVSLEIGTGTVVTGDFSTIDWSDGPYFIKSEIDLNGGANYTISGTSELLSVPYALHAETADNFAENDPDFNSSAAAEISSDNIIDWNNKLDSEVDGSITNELQSLALKDKDLSISEKNTITLPFFELTTNAVNSLHILNNSISDVDISSRASISVSKIAGTSGVEFVVPSDYKSWADGQTQMQTLESITISAPTDGFVLLMLTGNMILFKNGRTMKIGVGTSSSEMLTSMSCGRLDGTSSNRFYEGFSVSHVVAVKAGSNTFYALAQGSPIFSLGIANVSTSSFIGVFIPKRY